MPGHSPFLSPWQPPRGGWLCRQCDYANDADADRCHDCNRGQSVGLATRLIGPGTWAAFYTNDDGPEGAGPTREAAIADLRARFPRSED